MLTISKLLPFTTIALCFSAAIAAPPALEIRTWESPTVLLKNTKKSKFTLTGDCTDDLIGLMEDGPKRVTYTCSLEDFSKSDLDYLEKFSLLPPPGDPRTTDFDTFTQFNVQGTSSNRTPKLAFGVRRALKSYSQMGYLRMEKLFIDVLSPEAEREKLWNRVEAPWGYFPKLAVNEFERRRLGEQFLKDTQSLQPFKLKNNVYLAGSVSRGRYDFKRNGYYFELGNTVLAKGDQQLSKSAFWPIPQSEAEALPKNIFVTCMATLRPVGLLIGEGVQKNWIRFVFEPVSVKFYRGEARGIWRDMIAEVPVEQVFTIDAEAEKLKINTNYNDSFIAK